MAIFKLTTKKLLVYNGKRFEAGMTAEVPYAGNTFPWNTTMKTEIKRQLMTKYNADYPDCHINVNNFSVEKL